MWKRSRIHGGFGWESVKEVDRLEDLDLDGRIFLKMSLREGGWETVDWIQLAEIRDLRGALVNSSELPFR